MVIYYPTLARTFGALCMSEEKLPVSEISLNPDKRVLFLTKDLGLIQKQLYEGLNLKMEDLTVDDLSLIHI